VKAQQKFDVPESLKGGENWNTDAQKALCAEIAEAIGFDFSRGRLDVSFWASVHTLTVQRLRV
jgi:Zn-dependent M32 family carboxypeptidase